MDDGDLGDNIAEHADAAEEEMASSTYRFRNDDAHLTPSRWWFASSAFPMMAGTLGPVASAFSICALGRPWRQYYPPGSDVSKAEFIEDPAWLIGVNAFQLIVALISNAFLLLNMGQRVRFSVAQPITIAGWYISAICLLALDATASGPLLEGIEQPEHIIWSQAFYYGIWAAILYFVVASLMALNFWGAWTEHYPRDFVLTPSQRTLMLQTIMFLMYLLLGALVFSTIEGWNYLDAVYWANVTLFTIGFGDYSPATTLGRALQIPYALIGIISLGLVIGSIRSLVLDRGARRLDARMEEKKRRKKVKTMTQRGNDEILKPIQEAPASNTPESLPATEFDRRRVEFSIMRKVQRQASLGRRWVALAISLGSWFVLWLLGAFIFYKTEARYQPEWNYFNSFYFCFTALTTVGYGDLSPISNAGKSFFVFWSLLALPTMTVLISNAGDTVVKVIRDGTNSLGTITILPGEGTFKDSFRHIVSRSTFGKAFPDYIESAIAGIPKGEYMEYLEEASDEDLASAQSANASRGRLPDIEGRSQRSQTRPTSTFTSGVRRSLSRLRDAQKELPTGPDLYFLLISEIQVVSKHHRESKPKRYNYDEWAWYLRLIGEDERSPDTHRKARPKEEKEHNQMRAEHAAAGQTTQPGFLGLTEEQKEEERLKWSWIGHRSPLMGGVEESEWILDRLTERLKESLSTAGRHNGKMPLATDELRRRSGSNLQAPPPAAGKNWDAEE